MNATTSYHFPFLGQDLFLLPEKAVFWSNEQALLIADLHLGKVGHFRKAGLPVPSQAMHSDYSVLTSLLLRYPAKKIYVLGDFFHSDYNSELELFQQWKLAFPELHILLIKGNHDILPYDFYGDMHIEVVSHELERGPFLFTHKPVELNERGLYNLAGHIHPAVELRGKARQSLTLSCFYFSQYYALLPAFGQFTGKARIQPKAEDEVFVILRDKVVKVKC